MKKAALILTVLIILGLVGGLYYAFAQLDKAEQEPAELVTTNPFPYDMPEVIMHPVPLVPLY